MTDTLIEKLKECREFSYKTGEPYMLQLINEAIKLAMPLQPKNALGFPIPRTAEELMKKRAPSEIPVVKRGFEDISHEYQRAQSDLEDKMLEFDMTDWDRVWTDPYDSSIEFGSAAPDDRLSPEAQEYLYQEGFARCWLNHTDGMETYYVFHDEKWSKPEGYRKESAPHRKERNQKQESVEESRDEMRQPLGIKKRECNE